MIVGRVRVTVLAAFAVLLAAFAAWFAVEGSYVTAAVLFVFAAAFPAAYAIHRRSESRWIGSVAVQPAILTAAAIAFGVCEVVGIGVKRDVGRGIGVLFGSGLLGYGTFLIARAYRSRD